MSQIHSSRTVNSSDSVSISSNTLRRSLTEKTKHANREKLILTPFALTNTSILFINTHGGVYLDKNTIKKKDVKKPIPVNQCLKLKSPFDVLFRIIVAAPGETLYMKKRFSFPSIDFESPSLSPQLLGEQINATNPGHNYQDLYPLARNKMINMAFASRYHKLINYKNSPYCVKVFSVNDSDDINETLPGENQYSCGIFFLRGGSKTNLLYDAGFLNWMKRTFQKETYLIAVDKSNKQYLKELYSHQLFKYLNEELKIKTLFVIDFTCETVQEFPAKVVSGINDFLNLPLMNEIMQLWQSHTRQIENLKLTPGNEKQIAKYNLDKKHLETVYNDFKNPTFSSIAASQEEITEPAKRESYKKKLQTEIAKINTEIDNYLKEKEKSRRAYDTNMEKRRNLYHLLDKLTDRPDYFMDAKRLNAEKLKLQLNKQRTDAENLQYKRIKQSLKAISYRFYHDTKKVMPQLRELRKYQSNAKQNKDRWHVVKENDKRTR
jgi:hypothetical protein